MLAQKKDIFDAKRFDLALQDTQDYIGLFREQIKQSRHKLEKLHDRVSRAALIVDWNAWLIDQLLIRAWKLFLPKDIPIALIAVGGYGRHELHPASDIDLQILCKKIPSGSIKSGTESFLSFLWDIGLDIGHSVRTVKDCVQQSKLDITVATNLMESRLLVGDGTLYKKMRTATSEKKLWPIKKFFIAKRDEQFSRHQKFDDATYNLEPNVKEGPGGLRDLQTIAWTTQRHFHTRSLKELVDHDFLKADEYKTLMRCRNFLWYVRNQLHFISNRREDRLLFDYQHPIAKTLGYKDNDTSLAIEQFMKRYFRTIKELSLLNEILLQSFDEEILAKGKPRIIKINRRFNSANGFIDVVNPHIFQRTPFAILELFLILQQNPSLKGVRANTIRLIRLNLNLINKDVHDNSAWRSLFMEIMRQPTGITHELRRMNKYGVLGTYLPVFGRIVGQMQHDLFHVLTVDEHTLFVVRNIRRFTVPEFQDEFPFASKLIKRIFKPERLYIAALFHDIAKGRGGNHAELAVKDVHKFCADHSLSEYDTRFIAWLVQEHLLMSWTAQRQDIYDSEVIREFAQKVGNQERLDNLYLLTVADMRGTSPKVWNAWKDRLLIQLYTLTTQIFDRGLDAKLDLQEQINGLKDGARELLQKDRKCLQLADDLWPLLDDNYFQRYNAENLCWHLQTIANSENKNTAIAVRYLVKTGGTELLIYTQDRSDLLVHITAILNTMSLNIVDARINTDRSGHALNTFIVLDHNDKPVTNKKELKTLQETLISRLLDDEPKKVNMRMPIRRLKHFPINTVVQFVDGKNRGKVMTVIAQDRPGLLHQIALSLNSCNINLSAAKISTYGERVEDIFFIDNANSKSELSPEQLESLSQDILQRLNMDTQTKASAKKIF